MLENEFFYRLSPDVVLDAIEMAGFLPSAQCQPLNSLENRVYHVVLDGGSNIVAKFYRPARWTKQQILEEHEFLFELKDLEIPVCEPSLFPDGSSLQEIDGIYFAIWPMTGGREPAEFSDNELEILGRTIAQIHNTGAIKKATSRLTLTSESMIDKALYNIEKSQLCEPVLLKQLKALSSNVATIYDDVSQGVPHIRIHGDCHLGNILHGTGWHILDFDDFMNGPAVQDLWMLIQNTGASGRYQKNILLDAYRTFRDFDDSWFKLAEPLRAMRMIHFAGWISKRWQDPAFQHAFPHFKEKDYWHEEVRNLSGQITIIEKSLSLETDVNMYEEEPELTNKDFFWDM